MIRFMIQTDNLYTELHKVVYRKWELIEELRIDTRSETHSPRNHEIQRY